MKNWPFRIGFIVIGIIIAIAYWQFYRSEQQAPVQIAASLPISAPQTEPVIQHPVTLSPEDLKATEPIINPEQPLLLR